MPMRLSLSLSLTRQPWAILLFISGQRLISMSGIPIYPSVKQGWDQSVEIRPHTLRDPFKIKAPAFQMLNTFEDRSQNWGKESGGWDGFTYFAHESTFF